MKDALETIHSLHSTHGNFLAGREVPDGDLDTILKASVRAATASARQNYSIVVVRERDRMKRITGYEASVCLVYCVDFQRIVDVGAHLGEKFPADSVMFYLGGTVDAGLAAQTAAIAARALGIDSLFTNGIHRAPQRLVYEELGLPRRHCFPLIALLLGYEDRVPGHKTGRLTGAGVIHHGRYSRLTGPELDQLVAAYDDPDSGLQLNPGWRDAGFDHYLRWFYAQRSRRVPEAKERELLDSLIEAGFTAGLQVGGGAAGI